MIILEKGRDKKLVDHLWHRELECKCRYDSCTATLIDGLLLKAYTKFRKAVGLPCIVNSGYRCPQHNANEGGEPLSRHQTGQAIDISYSTLLKEQFSNYEIKQIARESGFAWVKFYEGNNAFFHMDVR